MNKTKWVVVSERLFYLIYRAFCIVVHCVYVILYRFRGRHVPPVEDPILLMSATELAKQIRHQKLTSQTVVRSFINRIKIVEPLINATVDCCFRDAIEEAKKADDLIASRTLDKDKLERDFPLLGVPISIKVFLRVKGRRSTACSLLFKDVIAKGDAEAVTLVKRAGAIVIATTNCPEFGMNIHTSNFVHGTTYNPYNTSRTSGGSSGGEGALIAAAGSVIGLGNDMGGSIRIPSLFNGIFGHKPSRGLISNEGCFPYITPRLEWLVTPGPMCRYAEDLVTMMKILAPSDEITRIAKPVNFENIKVFYMYSFGENIPMVENVDAEMRNAITKVVSYFRTRKRCEVQQISVPQLRESYMVLINAVLSSEPQIAATLANSKSKVHGMTEFVKYFCFQSNFTLPLTLVSSTFDLFRSYLNKVVDYHKKLETEIKFSLNNILDKNSILILPTLPFSAPYLSEATLYMGSICYTGIFNILGMPATHCPVGFSAQGLPIGIQIVGQRGNDWLTIATAIELEKEFGGWQGPKN